MKKAITFILIIFYAQCGFTNCDITKLTALTTLMANRAKLMKDVAACKWVNANRHQAIAYDAKQEIFILNSVKQISKIYDLPLQPLLVFTQVQMDISKQIETYWFNLWRLKSSSKTQLPTKKSIVPLSSLREKIIAIDTKFFTILSENKSHLKYCSYTDLNKIMQPKLEKIKGIPKQPNFISMMSFALAQSFHQE